MRRLGVLCVLAILSAGGAPAMAQEIPDLTGTWIPTAGGHILDGPTMHHVSGTEVISEEDGLHQHTSPFVFIIEEHDGLTFWGEFSSAEVTESLIGAISVDGKRFVMADADGSFTGFIVDSNTLDYCYVHSTPTDRAVACGLLEREQ